MILKVNEEELHNWTYKLKSMKMGEVKLFPISNYKEIINTMSRLKRSNKGVWTAETIGNELYVKRIKLLENASTSKNTNSSGTSVL